jgi:hypothetical protein
MLNSNTFFALVLLVFDFIVKTNFQRVMEQVYLFYVNFFLSFHINKSGFALFLIMFGYYKVFSFSKH